jgi:hypothetical protein
MNYRCALAVLASSLLIASHGRLVQASYLIDGPDRHPSEIVLRTSELRSAYLVRGGVVRYDAADSSPEGVRRQLQRHFDVVIALLVAATPTSVQSALNRLEQSSGTQWSESDRDRVGQRLLQNRYVQLLRLKAYRDRGLFPLHEGQAATSAPIFVDKHDTACAVGHLMRVAGWKHEVASIQLANNLVYVTDIESGPVAGWVLTSGLTVEEAALIQPAYGYFPTLPPSIPDEAAKPMVPGWSGVFDDLRFSNFRFYRDEDSPPSVNANVNHSICNGFSCTYLPRIEDFDGTAWQSGWFGSIERIPFEGLSDYERIVVQFDVETVLPTQRIAGTVNAYTAYDRPYEIPPSSPNSLLLFAGDDKAEVRLHDFPNWDFPRLEFPFLSVSSGVVSFIPERVAYKQEMTVVTELLLRNGQPYQAQELYFNVVSVPEPSAMTLMAFGLVTCISCSGRKYRSRWSG